MLPSASSARSTKPTSGTRRPNSTDSTGCLENRRWIVGIATALIYHRRTTM